ncbi:unnamed protein product [Arabidopsis halleri]
MEIFREYRWRGGLSPLYKETQGSRRREGNIALEFILHKALTAQTSFSFTIKLLYDQICSFHQ